MKRADRTWLAAALASAVTLFAAETMFRYEAPIAIERPGAFVLLPLPASAYARVLQVGAADVRVVDARGERVPFALLHPRGSELQTTDRARDAALYPLPPRPAADGTWTAPVELTVEGDRINVTRRGPARTDGGGQRSGGWLLDLGERKTTEPPVRSVRFDWSGPAEFSASFHYETSDDLRRWQAGGAGQLMALASPAGALTQPSLVLPPSSGRFLRLVWDDPALAPVIVRAQAMSPEQRAVALDPPAELSFRAGPPPADARERVDADARSLYFDLGGALPVGAIELRWAGGTHLAPVRLEGRTRLEDPWLPIGAGVFFRLDRNGTVSTSAPVAIGASARYVRATPDSRAGALDPAQTSLVVFAPLASVLFATQGQPPYRLLAGSATSAAGALPVGTLVPSLDDERPRFGAATLGGWVEVDAAVRQAEANRRSATLRLVLLWTVLVSGVAGLSWMVWRLARTSPPRGTD